LSCLSFQAVRPVHTPGPLANGISSTCTIRTCSFPNLGQRAGVEPACEGDYNMAKLSIPGLASIIQQYPDIGKALETLQNATNNVANQTNASPVGVTDPPTPHSAISVKGGAGIMDVAITDNSPQTRGKLHFFDYSTDGFKTFHTKSIGPAKNWRGTLGNGTFQVRSYAQHDTSAPSDFIYHPPVSTSGGSEPAMQPGQGSGTGQHGFGRDAFNSVTQPKR
jgi:hypothetical protein